MEIQTIYRRANDKPHKIACFPLIVRNSESHQLENKGENHLRNQCQDEVAFGIAIG